MKIRETKCTTCGAPIVIDASCRNLICQYCGAAIVVANFEEIKVAEASANTQIVRERLNKEVTDRKRERIEQLEQDLHAAESSYRQSERIIRILGFCGCACFILMFVASWHFLWGEMLLGFVVLLMSLGAMGQKGKAFALRNQIDSMIK